MSSEFGGVTGHFWGRWMARESVGEGGRSGSFMTRAWVASAAVVIGLLTGGNRFLGEADCAAQAEPLRGKPMAGARYGAAEPGKYGPPGAAGEEPLSSKDDGLAAEDSPGDQTMQEMLQSAQAKSKSSDKTDLSNATLKQVEELKVRARNKATRLDALGTLIRLGSTELYRSGSIFYMLPKEQSAVAHKAAEAVYPYLDDVVTLAMCMQSPDRDLRYFAIRNAPRVVNSKDFKTEIPRSLIMPLRRVAETDSDSGLREDALRLLQQLPDQREYVANRFKLDDNPFVFSGNEKDDAQFNKRITAILRSSDLKARLNALMFIGSNRGSTAKMFWRNFDAGTLNAVIARARSSSALERGRVAFALPTLQETFPQQTRDTLVSMTRDPLPGVRWRAAIGLQDLMTTPDSKAAVENLLNDPDEMVRRFALISLGPLNYPAQLKAMSNSTNARSRELANQWLNLKSGALRAVEGRGRSRGSIE